MPIVRLTIILAASVLAATVHLHTAQGGEPNNVTSAAPQEVSYFDDYSKAPNRFLIKMTQGLKPGKALDVGMGQGRNAFFLAGLGWDVTGFDISRRDIELAVEKAGKSGVSIRALVMDDASFNFGIEQWDLVVLSYFPVRHLVERVHSSLKQGGFVLVEYFHTDTKRMRYLNDDFAYGDNELLQLFSGYRILAYEDVLDKQDWGMQEGSANRLVRLWAQKKTVASSGCTMKDKPYREGEKVCWNGMNLICASTGWVDKGNCE